MAWRTGDVAGPDAGGGHWSPDRLAPLGDRFVGLLIDLLVLLPFTLLSLWIRNAHSEAYVSESAVASQRLVINDLPWFVDVLLAVPPCLYLVGMIALRGATVGQHVMGLRVVHRATGTRVSWRAAIIRWAVVYGPPLAITLTVVRRSPTYLSTIWFLVVLSVMFPDRDRQGLHDKAAGVVVIADPYRT